MPRRNLAHTGGLVFHVLNRAVRRVRIFCDAGDFQAFENVLAQTLSTVPTRLLAYCVMPNHWHLVLWPLNDEMPRFMHRLTMTHAKRWHVAHGSTGTGPVYQNRYHAVPVQTETHLYNVLRYVERNPVRARLVERSEKWRWSSAAIGREDIPGITLADWPMPRPQNWSEIVNAMPSDAEEHVRCALYGKDTGCRFRETHGKRHPVS